MPKRPSPPVASRRPLSARKRAALAADRALLEEIWRNGRGPKAPRAALVALTADELEALLAAAGSASPPYLTSSAARTASGCVPPGFLARPNCARRWQRGRANDSWETAR